MHIGLIGGIGPVATVSYYLRLIKAFRSIDQTPEITIAHADMQKLIAHASSQNAGAQARLFAKHTQQLANAGCDVVAITALTGHFCLEETQALSPVPLLNAIEIIQSHCARENFSILGLLGSPPVLSTHLFGMLDGLKTIVPTHEHGDVGATYMELARTGFCTDEQRELLVNAGRAMIHENNADAILLAGTDLGLAFDDFSPGFPIVDALELHVQALVSLATGA